MKHSDTADWIGTRKTDFRAPRKPRLGPGGLQHALANAYELVMAVPHAPDGDETPAWIVLLGRLARLIGYASLDVTRDLRGRIKNRRFDSEEWEALRLTLRIRAGGGAVHKAVVDALCRDVARAIGGAS